MMMSLYARLGVFLLPASRNPPAPRSLIAFAAWSSFAHASVMTVQAYLGLIARRELLPRSQRYQRHADHNERSHSQQNCRFTMDTGREDRRARGIDGMRQNTLTS